MSDQVILTARVKADIFAQLEWLLIEGVSPDRATKRLDALLDRVLDLTEMPRRYPIDELVSAARRQEIRKLTYGAFVIRYRIDEPRLIVEVMAFRHGGRLPE